MKRQERNMMLRYRKERQKNILAVPGVHPFVLILDQLKPGFNVPKIFRSAEAFGAAAVHLINVGPFDPAPAKGSFRKVPAVFHENFAECHASLEARGYEFFRLDPQAEATICTVPLSLKSAFILGHEEFGCSFAADAFPHIRSIGIPQFGSVQSLNVSIASSIVMYEYVSRFARGDNFNAASV